MTERKTSVPQRALKARKRTKKKKPDFVRPESWRFMKLKESWRRPRGLDNKVRRKIKGWPPAVSVGYKGAKVTRGLHPSGFKEVLVHNVQDLYLINPDVEAARIAHRVGKKKRIDIIAEAKKREIFILNVQLVSEQVEEEVLPEEEKEKPEEKATTPAKKEEKPKRKPREKTKVSKKEQKPPAKKAEHPKKPQKKATAEKGAKKQ